MPRPKAMGPGSMKMGGPGKKPPTVSPMGSGKMTPPMGMKPPKPAGPPGGGSPFGAGAPPSPMGSKAAPGAGPAAPGGAAFSKGGGVRPGKKERVAMHAEGGPITPPSKQDTAKHHVETAKHHAKEMVAHHAHGGPVIAGHSTHGHGFGTKGTEHPKEQGISKGSDGHRGGVKGGGLERISSTTADSKPRAGKHSKAT